MKLADTLRAAWNEPELRQRILFIFAIFGIYVIGLHIQIPIPGVPAAELTTDNQFLGLLDTFSGGALRRLSIFALGLNPYITASIIMQLMTVAIPSLKKEEMEGGQYGRMAKARRTRYLTIVLCGFQGWGLTQLLKSMTNDPSSPNPLAGFFAGLTGGDIAIMVLVWTAGSMMVLWLGEQIQEKGIGQGVSLMIFAGIVVSFPRMTGDIARQISDQTVQWYQVGLLVLIFVAVTVLIVYFTQAQRRINIQHMRRNVGTKVVGGGSSFLPIPVNAAGVIPIIFAISLVFIPAQLQTMGAPGSGWHSFWGSIATYMNPTPNTAYWYQWIIGTFAYAILIFFFTYFWTAIQYNVEDIATRLKQQGHYIPGVRQGKQTEVFLDGVISRVTIVGALFLTFVALVPYWVPSLTGLQTFQVVGGTSLLIIVSVVLDLMRQIEANLIMRGYSR